MKFHFSYSKIFLIFFISSLLNCSTNDYDSDNNSEIKYNKFGIQDAHYSMWNTGSIYESGTVEQAYEMFDNLDELHIKNFRYTIYWTLVERNTEGDYDWGPHDQLISYLAEKGIELSIMFQGVNYFYFDPERPPLVTNEPYHKAWLAYIEAVVKRYGDTVTKWEIGNEEDSAEYWYPAPNPDDYSDFLISTATKIKSIQSDAFIIMGGVTPFPDDEDGYYGFIKFLTACFEKEILEYIDAVGIHTYRSMPEGPFDWGFINSPLNEKNFEDEILYIKNLIADYKPGIELWDTESGYVNFDYVNKENQNRKLYSQVKYLSRSLLIEHAIGLKGLTYFRLRVNHQFPGTVHPYFMGLIEEDSNEKRPAFFAFKTIAKMIGPEDVQFIKTVKTTGLIDGIETDVRIEIYSRNNQHIAAYWLPETINNNLKTVRKIYLELPISKQSYLVQDILKSTVENIDYSISQNKDLISIKNLPITDYPYILFTPRKLSQN